MLASFRDPDADSDNPFIFNPRKVQGKYVTPRGLELTSNLLWVREQLDEETGKRHGGWFGGQKGQGASPPALATSGQGRRLAPLAHRVQFAGRSFLTSAAEGRKLAPSR